MTPSNTRPGVRSRCGRGYSSIAPVTVSPKMRIGIGKPVR
jgi:hypothetical protein